MTKATWFAIPQRGLGQSAVVITRWNPTTERWEAAPKR